MHSSAPSSISVSSIVQYAFFAAVLYVLAGAPLSTVFGTSYSGGEGSAAADTSVEKLENLVIPDRNLTCAEHAYRGVHVLSREPLVVYIDGFLSEQDARHVVGARFVVSTYTYGVARYEYDADEEVVSHTLSHRRFGMQARRLSTRKFDTRKKHHYRAIRQ